MKRHISESVVIDSLGRRRYRPHTLYQATPATDSTKVDLALVLLTAVAGAPLVFVAVFLLFLFVTPGPVR
jgi:hypothetical protein